MTTKDLAISDNLNHLGLFYEGLDKIKDHKNVQVGFSQLNELFLETFAEIEKHDNILKVLKDSYNNVKKIETLSSEDRQLMSELYQYCLKHIDILELIKESRIEKKQSRIDKDRRRMLTNIRDFITGSRDITLDTLSGAIDVSNKGLKVALPLVPFTISGFILYYRNAIITYFREQKLSECNIVHDASAFARFTNYLSYVTCNLYSSVSSTMMTTGEFATEFASFVIYSVSILFIVLFASIIYKLLNTSIYVGPMMAVDARPNKTSPKKSPKRNSPKNSPRNIKDVSFGRRRKQVFF
jgi:hypothetical protein